MLPRAARTAAQCVRPAPLLVAPSAPASTARARGCPARALGTCLAPRSPQPALHHAGAATTEGKATAAPREKNEKKDPEQQEKEERKARIKLILQRLAAAGVCVCAL